MTKEEEEGDDKSAVKSKERQFSLEETISIPSLKRASHLQLEAMLSSQEKRWSESYVFPHQLSWCPSTPRHTIYRYTAWHLGTTHVARGVGLVYNTHTPFCQVPECHMT